MTKPRLSISLTKGYEAIVDEQDFERVSALKWYVSVEGTNVYARNEKVGRMHRFILGVEKGQMVDHRNGNGLDNRRSNLRFCTNQENTRNRKHIHSLSGFKGVVWHKEGKKWQAQIWGKYLGLFEDKTEAARAYNKAAIELHGEFANLNKV